MNIDPAAVAAAVAVWTGAVLSPGPAFAAIVQSAAASSQAASTRLVLGITTGSAIYGAFTLFGLLWIISELGAWSEVIRVLGAAYLIWLGVQSWRSGEERPDQNAVPGDGAWGGFAKGLVLELSNPKGITFFLSVFAASMPLDASHETKLSALGLGLAIEIGWYMAAVFLFSRRPIRATYRRWKEAIARAFGTFFVAFGIGLLVWRH
jgi:threonine/homoserine/homoserine lactone efflux protein